MLSRLRFAGCGINGTLPPAIPDIVLTPVLFLKTTKGELEFDDLIGC